MPHLFDRVQETSTSSGLGSFQLGGPTQGYRSFLSTVGVSGVTLYAIVNGGAPEWEVGVGTLADAVTLVRTTVTASSNGGARVDFSAGLKTVFCDASAWLLDPLASLTPGQILVGGADGRVTQAGVQALSSWTNGDPVSQTLGQAVYGANSSVVRLAKADLAETANVLAFVADASVANAAQGRYLTQGVLGGLSGLVPDAVYFLSSVTAGAITTTPPSSGWLVEVGLAASSTELLVRTRLLVGL